MKKVLYTRGQTEFHQKGKAENCLAYLYLLQHWVNPRNFWSSSTLVPVKLQDSSSYNSFTITVNSEIFVRILFSRIAFKDIFATLEICDLGMIYVYQ